MIIKLLASALLVFFLAACSTTPKDTADSSGSGSSTSSSDVSSSENGETTICIFSALKRNFPMKIDMMEKHPLGSQAFIPMKETTFLVFVAPKEEKLDLNKIEAFIIPPGIGVNYNPGTWHFPLISTEDMNFLVVDRKGSGDNLVIENLDKENITLKY